HPKYGEVDRECSRKLGRKEIFRQTDSTFLESLHERRRVARGKQSRPCSLENRKSSDHFSLESDKFDDFVDIARSVHCISNMNHQIQRVDNLFSKRAQRNLGSGVKQDQ